MAAAAGWAVASAWNGWYGWRRSSDSVRRLDDALGLQQRLVTVQEFGDADPPPSLLPTLLADAEQRVSAGQLQLPPLMRRPTAAVGVLLLALLLWPRHNPFLQMASRSRNTETAPRVSLPEEPGASPQQPSGAPSQDGTPSQPGSPLSSDQASPHAGDQRDARTGQAQPDQRQHAQGQPQQGQGQGQQSASSQQSQGSQAGQAQPGPQGQSKSSAQVQQAGGAQQDAMKADIQELLQELSGELQQMETQLARADNPNPAPGTAPGGELLGGAEPLPEAGKHQVPIQLKTDDAPSTSPRTGGGVGEASGRIDRDAPKAEREETALSDAPSAEDAAAARQPIPPEYRGAFERLQPGAQESR